MATELTDGDIVLYTLRYSYQGQTLLNTWLFQVDQFVAENIDYEDFCDAAMLELEGPGDFIEQLEPLLVVGCVMVDHRMQRIHPTRNRPVIRSLNLPGTNVGIGAPANVAAVVSKFGNTSGRFAIGSWHQAGIPTSELTATGTIATAFQTDLGDAVRMLTQVNIVAGFPGTVLQAVLWGKAVPARVTPIQQVVPQATSRVMRRRTVGLGI